MSKILKCDNCYGNEDEMNVRYNSANFYSVGIDLTSKAKERMNCSSVTLHLCGECCRDILNQIDTFSMQEAFDE